MAAQAEIRPVRQAAAQAEFDLNGPGVQADPFHQGRLMPVIGPPIVTGENRVSTLGSSEKLIRALAEWRPR